MTDLAWDMAVEPLDLGFDSLGTMGSRGSTSFLSGGSSASHLADSHLFDFAAHGSSAAAHQLEALTLPAIDTKHAHEHLDTLPGTSPSNMSCSSAPSGVAGVLAPPQPLRPLSASELSVFSSPAVVASMAHAVRPVSVMLPKPMIAIDVAATPARSPARSPHTPSKATIVYQQTATAAAIPAVLPAMSVMSPTHPPAAITLIASPRPQSMAMASYPVKRPVSEVAGAVASRKVKASKQRKMSNASLKSTRTTTSPSSSIMSPPPIKQEMTPLVASNHFFPMLDNASDSFSPKSDTARAVRRKKHNEIELRRRERMKVHFAQLENLCEDVLGADAARRKDAKNDKDAILVLAIQQLEKYSNEILALKNRSVSSAASMSPNSPSPLTSDSSLSSEPGSAAPASVPVSAFPAVHLGRDGQITSLNATAAKLLGDGTCPQNLSFTDVVHPEETMAYYSSLQRLVTKKSRCEMFKARIKMSGGEFRSAKLVLTPANHAVTCFEAILLDV